MVLTIIGVALVGYTYSQPKVTVGPVDDFAKHVYAGTIITVGSGIGAYAITKRPFVSSMIGFGCGVLAGFGKEYVWDRGMKRGVFNKEDIAATAWGAAIGTIVVSVGINIHRTNKTERDSARYQQLSTPQL